MKSIETEFYFMAYFVDKCRKGVAKGKITFINWVEIKMDARYSSEEFEKIASTFLVGSEIAD